MMRVPEGAGRLLWCPIWPPEVGTNQRRVLLAGLRHTAPWTFRFRNAVAVLRILSGIWSGTGEGLHVSQAIHKIVVHREGDDNGSGRVLFTGLSRRQGQGKWLLLVEAVEVGLDVHFGGVGHG